MNFVQMNKGLSRLLIVFFVCLFTVEVVSGITLERAPTDHQDFVSDGSQLGYSFNCLFEESFETEEEGNQGHKIELHLDESRNHSALLQASRNVSSSKNFSAHLDRSVGAIPFYKTHGSLLI